MVSAVNRMLEEMFEPTGQLLLAILLRIYRLSEVVHVCEQAALAGYRTLSGVAFGYLVAQKLT